MVERAVVTGEGERWRAVVDRDPAADGRFVYAVITTGIYCRPSCSTPTPLRRNVRFFADARAAEAAGFYACKRCRPTLTSPTAWRTAAVEKACSILRERERAPSLTALAAEVGISRFHFHRVFKGVLGITPGEYADAVRRQRLTEGLEAGRPVAEAVYGAGYGSLSRVYERVRHVLGMTPAARRAGGAGTRIRFTVALRRDGHVLVASTAEGVCAIEFGDDVAELERRLHRHLPAAVIEPHDAEVSARVADVARRTELPSEALGLPADVHEVALRARLKKSLRPVLIDTVPATRLARPEAVQPASPGAAPAIMDAG